MTVALVDCNNFYASCERVFNPGVSDKPLVVLSNNDGCVVARSNEAKKMGVPAGVAAFKIQDLLRSGEVVAFSSNYALYGDISGRVMETLAGFTPRIEVYSIDEAFLDLSAVAEDELEEYGRDIRATVAQWVGMPVSIGIAETKTLAKVAVEFAKKRAKNNGVVNLAGSPYRDRALALTSIKDVWGVGRQYGKFLMKAGVKNALCLKEAGDGWVKKHMGVVGLRTVNELRGTPCLPFELTRPPKQQICVSRTFGRYVRTRGEMREAVAVYTTRAAEKLRRQNYAAGAVMVFMLTNRFRDEPQYSNSVAHGLPVPTDSTRELIECALRATDCIFRDGYRYNKAGVVLSELTPADEVQLALWDPVPDRRRERRATNAIDDINAHLGPGTVRYGATGDSQRWKTKFLNRSPRYTTRWDELPSAG